MLSQDKVNNFGAIYSGPWDKPLQKFTHSTIYQSLHKRFMQNAPWTQTKLYKKDLKKINQGKSVRGFTDADNLEKRYKRYDELFQTIKREGYKTQTELLNQDPNQTPALNNDAPYPELNEIGVCITRSGEVIRHGSGRFRLAIAKLLGLSELPVQIRVRHKKWEEYRKNMKNKQVNESELLEIISQNG